MKGVFNTKSQSLDVIMICKGWFDEDKHLSVMDALRGYYMREYGMAEEFVKDLFILTVILMPAAEEYLSKRELLRFSLSLLSVQYDTAKGHYVPVNEGYDTALKFLIDSIVSEIRMLMVKDSLGRDIIDLSEYSEKEPVI